MQNLEHIIKQITKQPRVVKIVKTGGPGGGKTQTMPVYQSHFGSMGWYVDVVPEAAAQLKLENLHHRVSMDEFQKSILEKMIEQEESAAQKAIESGAQKILLMCDRGIPDCRAYVVDEQTLIDQMAQLGVTFAQAYGRYNAVLHMDSAAKGAERFYEQNEYRDEQIEHAFEVNEKTLKSYLGHGHLRVIPNVVFPEDDRATALARKQKSAINQVEKVLGIPESIETERKFLVQEPLDLNFGDCEAWNIRQDYLVSPEGVTWRIRKKTHPIYGEIYYFTQKIPIGGGENYEDEYVITQSEYSALFLFKDPDYNTIVKKRHYFLYENHYFELDQFEGFEGMWMLEVELLDKKETFTWPSFLTKIREVTEDKNFSNKTLAHVKNL